MATRAERKAASAERKKILSRRILDQLTQNMKDKDNGGGGMTFPEAIEDVDKRLTMVIQDLPQQAAEIREVAMKVTEMLREELGIVVKKETANRG